MSYSEEYIIRKYLAGNSIKRVAEFIGKNYSYVRRRLVKNKVEIRSRWQGTDSQVKNCIGAIRNCFHTKRHSEKAKKKISETRIKRANMWKKTYVNGMKGKKHSKSTKKLMSSKRTGFANGMYGKSHSIEAIMKIRKARSQQKFPKVSSIEKKVRVQLEKNNVNFIAQWPLADRFVCDFFLPDENIVVECDGDYWHSLERVKKYDKIKDSLVKKMGAKIVRVKEHEIRREDFDINEVITGVTT